MSEPAAKEQSKEQPQCKPVVSYSERIFDLLVYGGIGFVGVFLASIPIAYKAKYGNWAAHFKSATEWLSKKGMNAKTAEQTLITTALMQGGNLGILPIKIAEDNKIESVEKISKIIGEDVDLETIKQQEKQTWNSIIKARIAAWIAVFSGFKIGSYLIGEKNFAEFENSTARYVCKIFDKKTHIAGKETVAFKYGKIAALDIFATAAASILLYVGSKFFAKQKAAKQQKSTEQVSTAENNAAAIIDSTNDSISANNSINDSTNNHEKTESAKQEKQIKQIKNPIGKYTENLKSAADNKYHTATMSA